MAHSNQGGVKNYLGNQKMVKAPLHWQSAPNHPTTELAYITKKEKDLLIKKDLHKSLKGGVNRGPSGIMSLNGWGDAPSGGRGPAGSSGGGGMETGKSYGDQETISVVPGGGTVTTSPKDTFEQSWSGQPGFLGFGGGYKDLKTPGVTPERGGAYKSRFGGILGALGRGALSIFGGGVGKVLSGIMTASDYAKRKGTGAWEGIQDFGARDEEGNPLYPNLESYLNRNKVQAIQPIETMDIREKFDRTGNNNLGVDNQFVEEEENNLYPTAGLGSAEGGRIGYERGRVVNPGGYNGVIDRNIANLKAALEYSDLTPEERAQVEADLQMSIEAKGGWEDQLLSGDPVSKAEGGIARLL